ncbi:TRAP-type C4-dicarboxylate transport system, small permease component [Hoeflea sp. IMCC20628]|uniref:TRAP transporter small permease n=1 Tax=Hoeflea sp. IMCC20628 TaxID=1620421 RepID=UPI00063AC822|nr:TRAP transporter small permease [Hoeflea sp. IMCC20628]AKH98920.1 TRAP-type C4-dicarboxylate transport system, small permease component [Hoeflea sp. IMCC20628]
MNKLDSIIAKIGTTLETIGSLIFLPLLALIVTIDVILRYVFSSPLSWGLEISKYLLLLFFMFGLLASLRMGVHIRVDIISSTLGRNGKRLLEIVSGLLLVFVFGLLIKKLTEEIPFTYGLPELTPEIGLPVWVFYAVIGAIASLTIIFCLIAIVKIVLGKRETLEDSDGGSWLD